MKKNKCLIVEDNEVNLMIAEQLIGSLSFETESAVNGAQAVSMAKDNSYDVIFMDIMMPVMDGIEATKAIRSFDKNIIIIGTSGAGDKNVINNALQSGMNDITGKPLVVKEIRDILTGYGIETQNEAENADKNECEIKISGINSNVGMDYMSGNIDAYKDILREFHRTGEKNIKTIEASLLSKDYSIFVITVHAVKSSSLSIGAKTLSDMALELEKNGKAEKYDYIEENVNQFIHEYKKIITGIEEYFDSKPSEKVLKPINKNQLLMLTIEMMNSIKAYNSDKALEAAEEIGKYEIDGKLCEEIEKVIESINDYKYNRAFKNACDFARLLKENL